MTVGKKSLIIAIAIASIFIFGALFNFGITGAAIGKGHNIPYAQCHNLASSLDKQVQNLAVYQYSSTQQNPCTGITMPYDFYLDSKMGGFFRVVFQNGDVRGHKLLENYIICSDGRAEITSRLGAYYYNSGRYAWGLWYYNPHMDYPYKETKCSTI